MCVTLLSSIPPPSFLHLPPTPFVYIDLRVPPFFFILYIFSSRVTPHFLPLYINLHVPQTNQIFLMVLEVIPRQSFPSTYLVYLPYLKCFKVYLYVNL